MDLTSSTVSGGYLLGIGEKRRPRLWPRGAQSEVLLIRIELPGGSLPVLAKSRGCEDSPVPVLCLEWQWCRPGSKAGGALPPDDREQVVVNGLLQLGLCLFGGWGFGGDVEINAAGEVMISMGANKNAHGHCGDWLLDLDRPAKIGRLDSADRGRPL